MSTAYSEFARVCQQVKHWPSDWRQHLAEEIAKSLASEPPTDNGEWNDAKNERRHDAIRIHLSRLAPSTAARALGLRGGTMMKTTTILHRVLEPVLRSLPPEAARQIVRAEADEELQQRVQELAGRANEGTLTPDEQREYEAYVDAGDIVATLQAVARKTLQAVAG